MALLHYLWSRVAASNATADANINFQEGQAPSSVNDSARALMASAAGFRDDIAGAIVTGGTSTNYTISSYQVFDTLAHMDKMVIAFTPHTANGATVTLNVDGLGAKPLRISPNVELQSNSLITGTPYAALYNNSDAAWYLFGALGSNPYNVPLASGMDYWGSTAPNSAFAIPIGQAISRTTYASLFALISTTYGAGDTTTTFNLPDKRGRVSAAVDGTGRIGSVVGASLGSAGGVESQTLVASQTPTLTSTNATQNISVSSTRVLFGSPTGSTIDFNPTSASGFRAAVNDATFATATSSGANSISVVTGGTGGTSPSHPNMQPTIVCNYIMRVI